MWAFWSGQHAPYKTGRKIMYQSIRLTKVLLFKNTYFGILIAKKSHKNCPPCVKASRPFKIGNSSLLSKLYIYPKYSKHWLSTVADTINCVCNKILNHGLNHELLFSLFKFFVWKNILNYLENLNSYFVWYFSFTWCTG